MKTILKAIIVKILTIEAKLVLFRYKPKIVAVTGNVGKTSTKDAIYTLLSKNEHARKSQKSFNSEFGVPLTVLGLPTAWSSVSGWLENIIEGFGVFFWGREYPEWLVLEVGADRPGDIRKLHWLKPHIVVYTRFPDVPVHVEYFESPDDVTKEKRELAKALRPSGTLIVNADDPKMRDETVQDGQRILSYGFTDTAMVQGSEPTVAYEDERPVGMSCSVSFQEQTATLMLHGTLGVHQMYAPLAALAVALSEGTAFPKTTAALTEHIPPPGRMRILRGMNGSTIVDDTYNASPVAVEAGLSTVEQVQTSGKRILVLGDMMELGDFSVEEHRKVGELVAGKADVFIAVGVRMREAAEIVRRSDHNIQVESVQDGAEATDILKKIVGDRDVVYVKGSQSVRLERVVEDILVDPKAAPKLLVRQDKEWKER